MLLLDEPLGALDLKLRQEMQIELKRIQREVSAGGITFVYVTHDQDEALTMSDRIAVFNEGRIEQIGTPAEIYEHPDTEFVAGFVGISNMLERDGRRFTVRPEKIHLHEGDGAGEPGRSATSSTSVWSRATSWSSTPEESLSSSSRTSRRPRRRRSRPGAVASGWSGSRSTPVNTEEGETS